MSETIFLAGGSGVVGLKLIPLLRADGWHVVASTQSAAKFKLIEEAGAEPALMNAFHEDSVLQAVTAAKPAVIIHQLTSLPDGLKPELMAEARERNAQIRDVGTRHLVAAAKAVKVRRMVAQSIAWAYAESLEPHAETDPLDKAQWGVASLENQVMAGPFEGVVLRYGFFYGPGTGFEFPTRPGSLHIDDAAQMAAVAAKQGEPGIYNIAESDGAFDVSKAVAKLGFAPRQHGS